MWFSNCNGYLLLHELDCTPLMLKWRREWWSLKNTSRPEWAVCKFLHYLLNTSVMIIIAGASLSEQHTDLLICYCTKQDSSRTGRYLGITYDKPTARTGTVNVSTRGPIFVILKFKCTRLKFSVYGCKQTDIHTHVRNAVTLVWGSLRLAPITCRKYYKIKRMFQGSVQLITA